MSRKTFLALALLACATLYRPAVAQSGDPSGFCDALNAARAARNLPAVAYDAGLASYASGNNAEQAWRGIGHFINCGTGQCSAAAWDAANALAQWSASGPHAAILFNPAATSCGFSCAGGWATANIGGAYTATATAAWSYSSGPVILRPRRRGLFRRW